MSTLQIADDFGRRLDILNRARRRFMDEKLKPYQLCSPRYWILLYIVHHPGCSQDAVGLYLHFDKSNITRGVRALVDMGLIERRSSEEDRRLNLLTATQDGIAARAIVSGFLQEWNSRLTDGLSEEDKRITMRTLSQMLENCSDYTHCG